jgi:hypothetical protein
MWWQHLLHNNGHGVLLYGFGMQYTELDILLGNEKWLFWEDAMVNLHLSMLCVSCCGVDACIACGYAR